MTWLRFAAMRTLSAAFLAAAMVILQSSPAAAEQGGDMAGQCPASIDFRHPDIPAAFAVLGLDDASRWTGSYTFVKAVITRSFVDAWVKADGGPETLGLRCDYRLSQGGSPTDPRYLTLSLKAGDLAPMPPGPKETHWREVRTVAVALDPQVGARYETAYECRESSTACKFHVHMETAR